jgi:hypothetical protein
MTSIVLLLVAAAYLHIGREALRPVLADVAAWPYTATEYVPAAARRAAARLLARLAGALLWYVFGLGAAVLAVVELLEATP